VKSYFAGIDGGGTKTAAAIVEPSMIVLGEGLSGPSNHLRVGTDEAVRNISSALHQALSSAGLRPDDLEFTYCGIAGSDHPLHRQKLVDALRDVFPAGNFTVDSDARVALTAGVGTGAGVVVIAGTGSVAFGRNDRGEEARAGGWGPTLGDEGSGYSIARRGLAAVVRSFDGRDPQTLITDLLCTHYGMCDIEDLPYFVYAPTTHADDIATYFRLVLEAAQNGDPTALEIFRAEGRELGLTVVATARRLKMLSERFPVAYVGGAFRAGELLLAPAREVILGEAPGADLRPAAERPVIGAARLAVTGAAMARPSRRV
jgi:N-acetylglucosamine kinase-like BadF-type ATPase